MKKFMCVALLFIAVLGLCTVLFRSIEDSSNTNHWVSLDDGDESDENTDYWNWFSLRNEF